MFKDKTIVYDEVNGHWINLDGDENDLAPAAPHSMVTRRQYETNLAMSGHPLLLVDPLHTFGLDFESEGPRVTTY